MNISNQYTLQDPRFQYDKSPGGKPDPKQPEPGLDAILKLQADHGETSYKGNQRLENRRALITGGDSGIGRAVAIAFAREGADVAIVYLPSETQDAQTTIQEIQKVGRKTIGIPGDISH